ncbi:MAG TPA: serine hydrolase [Chloroflexota bacterium]|nr:serine hydrolase [Chloroflexota bacterium]
MTLFRFVRLLASLLLLLVGAPSAVAAQPAPVWLQTVRDTPLWSGAADPAERFTTLPSGAYALLQISGASGRSLVYYPGDGDSRQPGTAWISTRDVQPSGPPAWLASSELDGSASALPSPPDAPHRAAFVVPPRVTAPEIAVVDDTTGLLLYGQAAHARESPASTTKILTALLALERAPSLDATVPITVDGWAMAAADGSSVMGLVPGRRLTLRTLLYGLLLPSGNDAAEQLARSLDESPTDFVTAMNDRLAELGLRDTHFANPSGLDADGHFSSAYDLAQLARVAMRDPTFSAIVATEQYAAEGYELRGHNPLIGAYSGADGVKTGTSDQAGRVIVASATRGGHRVYVVLMHSEDLAGDSAALFDWAWSSFAWD